MSTATLNRSFRERLMMHVAEPLGDVSALLAVEFQSPHPEIAEVTDHVSQFRGKMVRPIVVLLTGGAAGSQQLSNGHTMVAAALELIHTATLVHDDVIDEADERRHLATVHRKWNPETSVLLGDYLFSKAFRLTAQTGDAEACRLIGKATDRTCEAELLQGSARRDAGLLEIDYFRIIRGKTAQLFGVSAELGARFSGAARGECRRLRDYGLRLGLAFQIADDILDLTGDAAQTGKDTGNDLQNGRMTLPLIRCRRACTDAEWEDLVIAIAAASESTEGRDQLHTLPQFLRGIESAQSTAEELATRAIRSLGDLPPGEDKDLLTELAHFACRRTF